MGNRSTSPFGGVIGRVLREAFSLPVFGSGVILLILSVAIGFVISQASDGTSSLPELIFSQLLIACALARFALNGYAGEWAGGLLSSAGGSFGRVLGVAAAYLLLTFAWLVPMMIGGRMVDGPPLVLDFFGGPPLIGRAAVVLIILYLVGFMVTPPLFLAAAVLAQSFGELFSGRLWRIVLGPRRGELVPVYALYLGGSMIAAFAGIVLVGLAALVHWKFALVVGTLVLAMFLGLLPSLLGRLIGFYAFYAAEGGMVFAAEQGIPYQDDEASPGAEELAGPPPLDNARTRVDLVLKSHGANLTAARTELEMLRDAHAPSAVLLATLARLDLDSSQPIEAIAPGVVEAIRTGLAQGEIEVTLELARRVLKDLGRLGLDADTLHGLAREFRSRKAWNETLMVYRALWQLAPGEIRTVKGYLQVAQDALTENNPKLALQLYDFLIKSCPDSPLVDFMKQGKAEAEARLGSG